MQVRLIKKHKIGTREFPVGFEYGVTNGHGEELIKNNIAVDCTTQYNTRLIKARDEDNKESIEKIIEKSNPKEEKENKNKSNNNS